MTNQAFSLASLRSHSKEPLGHPSIQVQADNLILLINEEISKAVLSTRNQIFLEMKPILDALTNGDHVGENENGEIHPDSQKLALERQRFANMFANKGSASTNSIANGEESPGIAAAA